MRLVLLLPALAALGAVLSVASPAPAQTAPAAPEPQQYTVRIVKTFPHDPKAFTEGLFYDQGFLYESTGRNGSSWIRKVSLDSGKVLQSAKVSNAYFGEGIAAWKGRIISLTWQTEKGFVWDQGTLHLKSSFSYVGEGWGMTHDSQNLIMSDGTPVLKFLDPDTLKVSHQVMVTLEGKPLEQVNELEYVDGAVLANIWMTRDIVRIDPKSGQVTGIIDLSALPEEGHPSNDRDAVANGIAYDAVGKRLFVTGKLWPHLYQIELVPAAAAQ
jgi:glutamine cyclotransferase